MEKSFRLIFQHIERKIQYALSLRNQGRRLGEDRKLAGHLRTHEIILSIRLAGKLRGPPTRELAAPPGKYQVERRRLCSADDSRLLELIEPCVRSDSDRRALRRASDWPASGKTAANPIGIVPFPRQNELA